MGVIDQICDYAAKARKHGTFSLDKEVQTLSEGYMKDWLDLMITERDPKKLKIYMFTEMANMANRHKERSEAVENDLMKEQDQRMPINVERQSRVTFGGTKK